LSKFLYLFNNHINCKIVRQRTERRIKSERAALSHAVTY